LTRRWSRSGHAAAGVFGLKAAIFPLVFLAAKSYSAASAPVAALFAVMTKGPGSISILRVYTLIVR